MGLARQFIGFLQALGCHFGVFGGHDKGFL